MKVPETNFRPTPTVSMGWEEGRQERIGTCTFNKLRRLASSAQENSRITVETKGRHLRTGSGAGLLA